MSDQKGYEGWAIVELFGHNQIAGYISEETVAGSPYLRVDVPATTGRKAFSKFFGAGAIYGITPSDELTVKMAAENFKTRPISLFLLPEKSSEDEDYEGEDY